MVEQRYDIGDNLYLVNYDAAGGYGNHAIAIEDKDANITMLGDWCFVLPQVKQKRRQVLLALFLASKKNQN